MTRLFVFLTGVLLLALLVLWFVYNPGQVRIEVADTVIETSLAMMTAVLLAFAGLIALATRGVTWLLKEAPFAKPKRQEKRTRKGYRDLNQAMVALASGDEKAARRLTRSAERLLPPQPLAHIIGAEAARLTDDNDARKRHYEALAERKDASFLGVRGLVNVAREEGRDQDALRLVARACELRPQSKWALMTRFDLEVKATRWNDAAETLEKARAVQAYDGPTQKRYGAVLDYCRAVEADLEGHHAQAFELAYAATKAAPTLIPAAVLAAKLANRKGDQKKAQKIVKASYDALPHPSLIDADAAVLREATPNERYSRAKKLVDRRPDDPESRMLVADRALAAGHLNEAHEVLAPLVKERADRAAYLLMAEIAERQHGADDPDAQRWRDQGQAMEALPGRWVCNHCASVRDSWTPVCPTCRSFDSYEWVPPRAVAPVRAVESAKPTPMIEQA